MKEGDGTKQEEASIVYKTSNFAPSQFNRTNEHREEDKAPYWAVGCYEIFPLSRFYFFYLPSPLSNYIYIFHVKLF